MHAWNAFISSSLSAWKTPLMIFLLGTYINWLWEEIIGWILFLTMVDGSQRKSPTFLPALQIDLITDARKKAQLNVDAHLYNTGQ